MPKMTDRFFVRGIGLDGYVRATPERFATEEDAIAYARSMHDDGLVQAGAEVWEQPNEGPALLCGWLDERGELQLPVA